MEICIINLVAILLLSILLAGVMIPQVLLIAFRKKLFDEPDERKIHKGAVPRLGGLVFTPVILFTVVIVLGINIVMGTPVTLLEMTDEVTVEMMFEFCGLILLYIVGLADDLIGVKYMAKFIVQILCGVLLVTGGLCVDNLHGLLGIYELPTWLSYAFTILIVVFFTNAINLIDGVDGLASGLSIAAALFYGFIFVGLGNLMYAATAVATLGVVIPFYYYNVFGNPNRGRKIFMGDTGSLTLGFILTFMSIRVLSSIESEETQSPNTFVLAFAPMLIPCFDVVRVFFRRIRHHKSPFLPDRTHIHHKLMALGMSSKVTMVVIVCTAIVATLLNVWLSVWININILVGVNLIVWIAVNMTMSYIIAKRKIDCDFNR